jgi:hypothetical protein
MSGVGADPRYLRMKLWFSSHQRGYHLALLLVSKLAGCSVYILAKSIRVRGRLAEAWESLGEINFYLRGKTLFLEYPEQKKQEVRPYLFAICRFFWSIL